MATQIQIRYISDLAVRKTKEFKEVKELLKSSGIVSKDADTALQAGTIAEMAHALTDLQASQFIDALIASKDPKREQTYSSRRIMRTVEALDDIKVTIDNWDFE